MVCFQTLHSQMICTIQGPHLGTIVRICVTHMCPQRPGCARISLQMPTASAEAEIISPRFGMDGLPALQFGECALENLNRHCCHRNCDRQRHDTFIGHHSRHNIDPSIIESIDCFSTSIPSFISDPNDQQQSCTNYDT